MIKYYFIFSDYFKLFNFLLFTYLILFRYEIVIIIYYYFQFLFTCTIFPTTLSHLLGYLSTYESFRVLQIYFMNFLIFYQLIALFHLKILLLLLKRFYLIVLIHFIVHAEILFIEINFQIVWLIINTYKQNQKIRFCQHSTLQIHLPFQRLNLNQYIGITRLDSHLRTLATNY